MLKQFVFDQKWRIWGNAPTILGEDLKKYSSTINELIFEST